MSLGSFLAGLFLKENLVLGMSWLVRFWRESFRSETVLREVRTS